MTKTAKRIQVRRVSAGAYAITNGTEHAYRVTRYVDGGRTTWVIDREDAPAYSYAETLADAKRFISLY